MYDYVAWMCIRKYLVIRMKVELSIIYSLSHICSLIIALSSG